MLETAREGLTLVPVITLTCLFLTGAWWVWNQRKNADEALTRMTCQRLSVLTGAVLLFHVLWAVLLTVLQYRAWQQDSFSRLLLQLPLDSALPISGLVRRMFFLDGPHGYFLFYVWGRFWWPVFISLLVFGMFAIVLWAWKHWGAQTVSRTEIWFLLLMAAVLGWPRMGIAWVSIVVLASGLLIGQVVFRYAKPPSLLFPTIVSGLWVLWFGMRVIVMLGAHGLIP